MTTTAIIAEMVAIGFVALTWMGMLALCFLPHSLQPDEETIQALKDVATPLSVAAVLISYCVGWLVNGLSYQVSGIPYYDKFKENILKEDKYKDYCSNYSYRDIRAIVYQSATPTFLTELDLDRTAMRIARTGILNFFMLFVTILLNPKVPNAFAIFAALLCAFSIIELYRRCKRYYNEIVSIFVFLRKEREGRTSPSA